MDVGQIVGLIFLVVVGFYFFEWLFSSAKKESPPAKTVLKMSMSEIEVDQKIGNIELISGQKLTIPKAVEMVHHFKKLPKETRDRGLEINGSTSEEKELFKAVIAVENEMAEARGADDEIIVLNEKSATFDRDIAQQVMQFYQGHTETVVVDDHPLTSHPKSVFEKPERN